MSQTKTIIVIILVVGVAFGVGWWQRRQPSVSPSQQVTNSYPHSRAYVLNERLKAVDQARQSGAPVAYEMMVAGSVGMPGSAINDQP